MKDEEEDNINEEETNDELDDSTNDEIADEGFEDIVSTGKNHFCFDIVQFRWFCFLLRGAFLYHNS